MSSNVCAAGRKSGGGKGKSSGGGKGHGNGRGGGPTKFHGKIVYKQKKFQHELHKGLEGTLKKPHGQGYYPPVSSIKDPLQRKHEIAQILAISNAVTKKDIAAKDRKKKK
jgi:hypothetical protein